MSRAAECIAIIQCEEGVGLPGNPYGDVTDDGGRTRAGVTQATFAKFFPGRDVFTATMGEIGAVYADYWKHAYCDELPVPLDLCHADFSFNATPDVDEARHVTESVKVLQRALGVTDDGELGPVTLGQAAIADGKAAAYSQLAYRWAFYLALVSENASKYARYLHAWQKRVTHLAVACGVPDPTQAPQGAHA